MKREAQAGGDGVEQNSREARGRVRRADRARALAWLGGALTLVAIGATAAIAALPTTRQNFYHPGTQPGALPNFGSGMLIGPSNCAACHADYNEEWAPFNRWSHSMHAQSHRDPIFQAAFAIAEQDAQFVGESCLRCHAPQAWLTNKVKYDNNVNSPNFGKTLPIADADLTGVSCSVCHRMVDPEYTPGQDPVEDVAILAALNNNALMPPVPGYPAFVVNPHNSAMVIDTQDRRRGPYDLDQDWQDAGLGGWPGYHAYLKSAFHESSRMCATCHDVSTPHFTRQPNGSYALNAVDQPPAPDKLDQFPEQRTYSEWSQSSFASGPINLSGRFGGNTLGYSSCQSCHMPATTGQGCALEPPMRGDLPVHNFTGANSWVLRAVRQLYPDNETGLTQSGVDEAIQRSNNLMAAASDMQLTRTGTAINVRIINFSGHKLPTGYTEGRRMWINVVFRDANNNVIAERGAYNPTTAVLNDSDTKVYEAKLGPDAALAAITGLPAGPAFRLVLSNKVYKDNRIPPIGFSNAAFGAVQAGHVPANQYADGQFWDDTPFAIPSGARSATVRVLHQTTSKEYIEFLRDANTSDSRGQVAFNMWQMFGKSTPVVMDQGSITIPCRCDWDGNGQIQIDDIFLFLQSWFAGNGDFNGDTASTLDDIFLFLPCFFANCVGY